MAKRKPSKVSPISISQIDLDALQEKCIEVIRRDIAYKMQKVSEEPLDAKDARAIVDYTKLFSEIKGIQEDQASNLTDEELEQIAENEGSDFGTSERD